MGYTAAHGFSGIYNILKIFDHCPTSAGLTDGADCAGAIINMTFDIASAVFYGMISAGYCGAAMKITKAEKESLIAQELEFIRMQGFEKRRVESLSGGEAQRVALVRAMLGQPSVMLLDEPFSALDLETRRALAVQTRDWLKQRATATIHVTHDPEEADLIADRVLSWSELFDSTEEE